MKQEIADEKSRKAREISKQCNLWLEHPWVAHDAHELAASAQEQVPNLQAASEHRRAAQYWAKKATEWESTRYHTTN